MKRLTPLTSCGSSSLAFLVLTALAIALTVVTTGARQGSAQDHRPTERQRAHSRAYVALLRQGMPVGTPGRPSLLEVPSDRRIIDETFAVVPPTGPRSAAEHLAVATCAADVVAIGRPVGSSAYLTEDASFILTDYQLEIEQVLHGDGVQSGDTVTYVRPGGQLRVRGRIVRASHSAYPSLTLDRRYILFMDRVEETSAYKISNGSSRLLDALLIDTHVRSLGPQGRGELFKTGPGLPLSSVTAAINDAVCAGGGDL